MLIPLRPAVPTQASAEQVTEIKLAPRVVGLALPVFDLHAIGRGPDTGLAIAAQPALFDHERLPQGGLIAIVFVVGMRLPPMLSQGGRLWSLLYGPHLIGALQKVDQRTGPGQLGLVIAQLAFKCGNRSTSLIETLSVDQFEEDR